MGRKYGITLYYFPETGSQLKKCLFGKSFKKSFKLQKVKFSKSSWLVGEKRIQHYKVNEARIDEKSLGVLISRKMTPKSTLKISPLLLKTSRAGNSQLTPDIHAITSYCENVLSPHLLIRKATMAGYRTPTKCSALVQQHVEGCGNRKYKVTLRHNPCSLEPLKK